MDAIKFLKEKNRMTKKCSIDCSDCPLSSEKNTTGLCCGDLQRAYSEIVVSIVEKWSEEHSQETRLSQFLKYYPNAPLDMYGIPRACVKDLGIVEYEYWCSDDCTDCPDCWNTPLEEELKNGN